MNTSLHIDFEQKLTNIVHRMCQQILYMESTPEGPAVTLRQPFLAAIKYNIMIESKHRKSWDHVVFTIPTINEAIDPTEPARLSHDILLLEVINPSLEQYLTCPTRAKEMYISKDRFHTQLAEMWLDQLLDETGDSGKTPYVLLALQYILHVYFIFLFCLISIEMSIRLMAGNHCKPHLMRASGTEKIFARLRVLMSWSFIGFSKPHEQSFQDIITWLEVSKLLPLCFHELAC